LANFADTDNHQLGERTAKMCLFSQDIGVDVEQAARLADDAYAAIDDVTEGLKPWYAQAKGIADYRRGEIAGAVEALQRSADGFESNTIGKVKSRLYLAMALYQAGQQEKAKEQFQSLEFLLDAAETQLTKAQDGMTHNSWNDLMALRLVRPEAEALILGGEVIAK
jgi:hypothetical protein